jgi:two-component system sensor histidine kinase KdpD
VDDEPDATGRVTLEPPAPGTPPALADGALLERAVANLIGNAAKHTDSDIMINISALGIHVELRVIDRGPGIPAGERDRVFRPFQRLGDRDNTAGVGLGLALARGLVEAMDGTLTPEDTPGGGVTMVVSLPAARTAPVPVSAEDEELLA